MIKFKKCILANFVQDNKTEYFNLADLLVALVDNMEGNRIDFDASNSADKAYIYYIKLMGYMAQGVKRLEEKI